MRRLLVFFIIVFFHFSCSTDSNDLNQANKSALDSKTSNDKELNEGKADSILVELNTKIKADLSNLDLYLERADRYKALGDFDYALQDINRAQAIDTNALAPKIALCQYWMDKGKFGFALNVAKKAELNHPESSELYLKLSELYLIARRNKESLAYADKAVKYDMFNPRAYYLKGLNFLDLKDTNRAISSYQTAVEQNPDYFEPYLELGLLYAAKDDPLAIEYYNNALSVRPNDANTLYSLGMYQQEHQMYNEAIQTYYTAAKEYPDFREVHFNLGYIHMYYLKLYREAAKYFNRAIEVDPKYYQAYYNRGYSFELMGDVNNALKDYNYALSIKPDYDLAAQGVSRVTEIMNR